MRNALEALIDLSIEGERGLAAGRYHEWRTQTDDAKACVVAVIEAARGVVANQMSTDAAAETRHYDAVDALEAALANFDDGAQGGPTPLATYVRNALRLELQGALDRTVRKVAVWPDSASPA